MRFLLHCPCGQKVEVTGAQAGGRVACACGQTIDVPTLRELQSLERVEDGATPYRARNWSARHGLIFLGGSIAVVALIVSAWLQVNRPRGVMVVNRLMPASDRKDAPWTDSSIEWLTGFKTLSPGEVWLTWSTTMPVGADPRLTIYGMRAQYAESRMAIDSRDYRYLAWAFGAVGVVLLAAGLLIPQPQARRGPARRPSPKAAE